MSPDLATIYEDNISTAWARSFLALMERGVTEISPLVVSVTVPNVVPPEDPAIRALLDDSIEQLKSSGQAKLKNLQPVHTVANTIFPLSLWNPSDDDHAAKLYERFERVWPRIKKHKGNRRGTYFQRLAAYRPKRNGDPPINQLAHVVQTYRGGNHRRSALQAAVFDPGLDHHNNHVLGFPCLHQVAFAPFGEHGLAVTGFYATQYVLDRSYGNYLGLCNLGRFVAQQLDRRLVKMTCVASLAKLGTPCKSELADLGRAISSVLTEDVGTAE